MRQPLLLSLSVLPLLAAGCHARPDPGAPTAPFQITVHNQGGDIHQMEVDYPNASFGRDYMPSGGTYSYTPKLIGSGPLKISFNDAGGKNHTATGPVLNDQMRATLIISIGEDEGIIFQGLPQPGR